MSRFHADVQGGHRTLPTLWGADLCPGRFGPAGAGALASGEEWNVEATPTTVIAGPGGKIKRFEGAISQRKLERALRETLYA